MRGPETENPGLSVLPHCQESPGSDESLASSQANALPEQLFLERIQGENDDKSDQKYTSGTQKT